jgi:hypothetical protein
MHGTHARLLQISSSGFWLRNSNWDTYVYDWYYKAAVPIVLDPMSSYWLAHQYD